MMLAETVLFLIALCGYFVTTVLWFLFAALKKPILSKFAIRVQFGAFAVHTAAIVLRWILMERLPLSNQYEFSTAFCWALCLVSLIFILKFRFPLLGAFASPVTLLLALYAGLQKINEFKTIAAYEAMGVDGVDRIRNRL